MRDGPGDKSVQSDCGLVGDDEIEAVYEILELVSLRSIGRHGTAGSECTEKIRSGSIFEVAEVMRDLCLLRTGKDRFR